MSVAFSVGGYIDITQSAINLFIALALPKYVND